ncbi:MAG TPA: hypothetical protein VFZ96_01440 [Actinomycetota bacterium]|nr:hypothetical protein [Actinomycetota bacterium]
MKLLRTTMMALAALIVAGTVASAATSFDEVPDPEPTVSPSPTAEPTVSPSPEAEPAVETTEGVETTESVESVEGKTPDFSRCKGDGYTGLANAICRHEELLEVKRDHQGLQNALDHLTANQEAKAERWAEKHGEDVGTTEGETFSCPGKSCEPHGNGNGH